MKISTKLAGFYLNKINLIQTVFRQGRQNIGKNIISRYSKGKISADIIGDPIYRSVSRPYFAELAS